MVLGSQHGGQEVNPRGCSTQWLYLCRRRFWWKYWVKFSRSPWPLCGLAYDGNTYISMISLLTHNVTHSTRHSFRPKINNQPLKKFLSLEFSLVKVVKNDFNISWNDSWTGAFMKQSLSLLGSKMGIFIAENELNGVEEIGFARTITSNHYIVTGVKRFHNSLVPVGFESLNNNLLDEHDYFPGNKRVIRPACVWLFAFDEFFHRLFVFVC